VPDPSDFEIARRESQELALRDQSAELSLCPSCGRQTATVGRGTCAECWQAKTADGQPAIRGAAPKSESLIGSILDDVPLWLWVAGGAALVGGLITALIQAL
jgi:protein-arginine kinase activator protein McsA